MAIPIHPVLLSRQRRPRAGRKDESESSTPSDELDRDGAYMQRH
jgi:hypothetical protein